MALYFFLVNSRYQTVLSQIDHAAVSKSYALLSFATLPQTIPPRRPASTTGKRLVTARHIQPCQHLSHQPKHAKLNLPVKHKHANVQLCQVKLIMSKHAEQMKPRQFMPRQYKTRPNQSTPKKLGLFSRQYSLFRPRFSGVSTFLLPLSFLVSLVCLSVLFSSLVSL